MNDAEHRNLSGYTSRRLVTQAAVWLHRLPSGYTAAVWLHRLPSGYTGRGVVTQAAVWLHRPLWGYTSRRLVTQAAVWLHRPLWGYTSRRLATWVCKVVQEKYSFYIDFTRLSA